MPSGPAIYVHLPFCPYICPYCDFAKWPRRDDSARRYLAALDAELTAAPQVTASTVYFGGGTPNTYAPDVLAELVESVRSRFSMPRGAEITVEANPDLALCGGFERYVAAGVTRLSIGVQSFQPGELRALGRQHRPEDVVEVVRRSRGAGIENVSLDLMFGVPEQTAQSWRATLDAALELDVEHISTYGLTVEEGTPYALWFARDPAAFAGEDLGAELYEIAIDVLGDAGYEHYEISNFARPGRRCAHNANYWANDAYLGFGVGAASYDGRTRRVNTRELETYLAAALAGNPIPGEAERLGSAARAGEAAMLALRTGQGVDIRAFEERYDLDFLERYRNVLTEMSSAGLLTVTDTHVALTRRGRLLANEVCGAFVEPETAAAATLG